ncbi:MAG: universal stress protein [Acidimicrobiales bacterium]|jgi:nucleotide-binding universal stress UspA family protein
MIQPVRAVVWLVEGTWQGCLDAAAQIIPPGAQVALFHVTPSEVGEIGDVASAGLLGRALRPHRPVRQFDEVADQQALEILEAAARRLGRENTELVHRRGRVEREVLSVVAEDVDLLVVARDGDRSRLGPHSLGHVTRFIVDHAPCPVLLVWPDEAPGFESIPPLPPHGPHRAGP